MPAAQTATTTHNGAAGCPLVEFPAASGVAAERGRTGILGEVISGGCWFAVLVSTAFLEASSWPSTGGDCVGLLSQEEAQVGLPAFHRWPGLPAEGRLLLGALGFWAGDLVQEPGRVGVAPFPVLVQAVLAFHGWLGDSGSGGRLLPPHCLGCAFGGGTLAQGPGGFEAAWLFQAPCCCLLSGLSDGGGRL